MRACIFLLAVLMVSQARAAEEPASKVKVDVYMESLCPDCRNFTRQLDGLLAAGFGDWVDLRYWAWGNVKNATDNATGQATYKFQHGPEERYFNGWVNCAQALHPDQAAWFPFVACLEAGLNRSAADAGERDANLATALGCAEERGLDGDALQACADGQQVKELEAAAARATWALSPPKAFVPWATANGVALGLGLQDIDRVVCVAVGGPGPGRPAACGSIVPRLLSENCTWLYA